MLHAGTGRQAELLIMLVCALLFLIPVLLLFRSGRRRAVPGLPALRAGAVSVRSRLGADVARLDPGDDAVARQAMADAAESYAASGTLLEHARTPAQLATAHRTALDAAVQAARPEGGGPRARAASVAAREGP